LPKEEFLGRLEVRENENYLDEMSKRNCLHHKPIYSLQEQSIEKKNVQFPKAQNSN
jgi:hypothetical protein